MLMHHSTRNTIPLHHVGTFTELCTDVSGNIVNCQDRYTEKMLGWVVTAVVVLAVLLRFCLARTRVIRGGKSPGEVRPPIRDVLENASMTEYDLRCMHAPKLTGKLFQFMIWLSFTRFGRMVIVPSIMRNSNLDRMGGVYLPEKPTLYPTPRIPPMKKDFSKPNQEVIQRLLGNEVGQQPLGFRFPTVADYIRVFRSGVCTPTDVAEAAVNAITNSNKMSPPLRAIVDCNRDVVMAMANASTERWRTGKMISPLDGVPVAMKGEFRVEPYEFHGGAVFVPELTRGVPGAVIGQKLKDAGAVIIGIANLQEFGTGTLGSNPNKLHLTPRNPYNTGHYTGGSSSGSAASVAAGLCPIAVGTDGGGSIRIPAGVCGVVGLKPTNRFIDSSGVLPLAYSVSASGPLCSSVLDTAIALDVMSKETEGEEKRASLEGLGETNLDGVTVGVYWKYFEDADCEIVQKCKAAVSQLQSLGATIVEISIPELEDIRVAHALSIMAEFGNTLAVDCDKHFDEITLETLLVLSAGYQFSAVEYINAQKQRTRAVEILKYIFEEQKVDIIVTPATACPPPEITQDSVPMGISDAVSSAKLMRYAFLANLTGIPGLVLPVGYTRAGLPASLQLMGQWYQEGMLLKVAWALENSNAFPLERPQVFYDLIEVASSSPQE